MPASSRMYGKSRDPTAARLHEGRRGCPDRRTQPGRLHHPGPGEDEVKVCEWLAMAAAVPGFIGFAGSNYVLGTAD